MDLETETCKLPYCKECAGAYKILVLTVAMIIFYYFFRYGISGGDVANSDPLNIKLFDFPQLENCCSSWPLSHFILFFALGLLFPDCAVPLLGLGAAWEGFEAICAQLTKSQRQGIRSGGGGGSSSKIEYSGSWWAGSFKDIILNCAGFFCGWLLNKLFENAGKKICVCGLNSDTEYCKV